MISQSLNQTYDYITAYLFFCLVFETETETSTKHSKSSPVCNLYLIGLRIFSERRNLFLIARTDLLLMFAACCVLGRGAGESGGCSLCCPAPHPTPLNTLKVYRNNKGSCSVLIVDSSFHIYRNFIELSWRYWLACEPRRGWLA